MLVSILAKGTEEDVRNSASQHDECKKYLKWMKGRETKAAKQQQIYYIYFSGQGQQPRLQTRCTILQRKQCKW